MRASLPLFLICKLTALVQKILNCSFCVRAEQLSGIFEAKSKSRSPTTFSKVMLYFYTRMSIYTCTCILNVITTYIYTSYADHIYRYILSLHAFECFLFLHIVSKAVEYILYMSWVRFSWMLCRNLLGEDLGPLNTKELEQLENQLETSLRHIRSTKVFFFPFFFFFLDVAG